MAIQASYDGILLQAIADTTGAKTFTVSPTLTNADGVLKVGIGLSTEEWFEVTAVDTGLGNITTGIRGLSLTVTGTLTEVAGNRKEHFPGEKIAIVTFPNSLHTQNTDTGTTATTFIIDSDADSVTLDTANQTSDHNFTFPDASGVVVTEAATQTLTNKTLTTPTLTSPVINTGVSGTALVTTVGTPGSDTLIVSEQGIREAITASVSGVAGIQVDGGTLRTGNINIVGGTGVSITDSPAGTFTIDTDAADIKSIILKAQIFA